MGGSKEKRLSYHFSHEHPLELTGSPPGGNTSCFGCKMNIYPGKDYYKCKTCTFFLHQVCHNMPKKVQHPADPSHHFTLHAKPSSGQGSLSCKACGHPITGFYYHCAKCVVFYHISCSALPLSVKVPSHIHPVTLEFLPPYCFECDLCKRPSSSGWLYRCDLCEFDAHIACAISSNCAEWLQNTEPWSRGNETVELSTRNMKNIGREISPAKSDRPEEFSQFSDALFSIDFAKSLLGNRSHRTNQSNMQAGQHEKKGIPEPSGTIDHLRQTDQVPAFYNPGFDSHNRDANPKNGLNLTFSPAINARVWKELEQENQKRKAGGIRDRTDGIEIKKSDTENSRHSCWSMLFSWFSSPRNDRDTTLLESENKVKFNPGS